MATRLALNQVSEGSTPSSPAIYYFDEGVEGSERRVNTRMKCYD